MLALHQRHRIGEPGELGLGQEALFLVELEQFDALRRVFRDQFPVDGKLQHRREHRERARRRAAPAADDCAAALGRLDIGPAFAIGDIGLETRDIGLREPAQRFAAEQWLDMALDIGRVDVPAGGLLVRLSGGPFGEVEGREIGDGQRVMTRSVPVRRGIAALRHLAQFVGGEPARLVRRQDAHPAEHQAPRAPFLGPVLHQIASDAARHHPHPEALQGAVADLPHEYLAPVRVGPDRIDDALAQFRHLAVPAEARRKHGGSRSARIVA